MHQEVKTLLFGMLWAAGCSAASSTSLRVDSLRLTRPFRMATPIHTDSTDVWGKPFEQDNLMMEVPVSLKQWRTGECMTDSVIPASEQGGLRLAGFQIENTTLAK